MSSSTQKILMCAPDYFGVHYVINPWMVDGLGKSDHGLAVQQWTHLQKELAAQADIVFVLPQPKLPDMVFTANAGIVLGKTVVVSRFQSHERHGEEVFFHDWFARNDFTIVDWPPTVHFEGAGDALFDRDQDLIWAAHGFRSDAQAPALLERIFNRRTLALRLADARFYHLDTCFCPLEGGFVMYFPPAFDERSQQTIADHIPAEKRIIIAEEDALKFACNAVELNTTIFMNGASDELQRRLSVLGFTVIITPLFEFMKAGGAAKCLTLKLVET
jgi:N-dimethylarginine dimethylaminohydrolase